jgi:hypothetical protein
MLFCPNLLYFLWYSYISCVKLYIALFSPRLRAYIMCSVICSTVTLLPV